MPMEVATINVYILSGVVSPGPLLLLEKGILPLRSDGLGKWGGHYFAMSQATSVNPFLPLLLPQYQ